MRDVLQAAGADLVGLQETEGGRVTSGNLAGVRWLAHQLDMHHAPGPSAREGIYGIALLSTWPILETTYRPLPAAHSVERGVLIATIDHPDGPITAAVTHLAVIDEARERARQAQALVDLLEPRDNVILLGDFNTPPDHGDDAYAILDSAYDDAWSLAGNTRESGPTQLDQDPGQRIDHIWLRGTWQVGSCHTSGTPEASDHRAVTCSISRETR